MLTSNRRTTPSLDTYMHKRENIYPDVPSEPQIHKDY